MSLNREREPVEVSIWRPSGYAWVQIYRYIREGNGSLTYVHPTGYLGVASARHWRRVKRES